MINIIHQLRMANGSLAKQRILRQHKDDPAWRQYLRWVYDESINYGVSPPNDGTFVDHVDPHQLFPVLSALQNMAPGSSKQRAAQAYSEQYGELFRLALGRSIRAGVTATTLNKIMPGLIPVFKVMLAKEVENKRYPLLASTKFDGVRVVAFVQNDKSVVLKTRNGKELNIASLKLQMRKWPLGVYDGELVHGDGLQAGRTSITGSVNKVLKGSWNDLDEYTYCIFDYVPFSEWFEQKGSISYAARYAHLKCHDPQSLNVRVVEQVTVANDLETDYLYQLLVLKGYEGLILRSSEDPYVWKRSEKLIKMKATNECKLRCVDLIEGKGKYEHMIGALVCQGTVKGKEIEVKVGSGLSDFDRTRDAEQFLNHSIEVLYNDVTKDSKTGQWSLFLPRFKRIAGRMET